MKKALYILLAFPTLLLFSYACIKEDLSQCATNTSITVTVKIAEVSGSPDDKSIVKDIVLYIYDENKKFLEIRETQLGNIEVLSYPNAGKLTVVAWCNTLSGSLDLTSFNSGLFLKDGYARLKKILSPNIYQIPDDILFGSKPIVNNQEVDEHATLYVTRVVASMNITVRNLKKFADFNDNNYSFIVGTTKTYMDFTGQYYGGGASYIPESSFNIPEEFIAKTFRLFPSREEHFSVKIFHDGTLIDEVSTANDNSPLQTIQNKTLNLLIEYNGLTGISVTVKSTEWNQTHQWDKIFN